MGKLEAIFTSVSAEIAGLDEYYPNSDLRHTYETNREKLIHIVEAFGRLWTRQGIAVDDFSILENGLNESWNVIYFDHVGKYLAQLGPSHSEVNELILRAICHKSWVTRRNVVDIIIGFSDADIVRRILVHGLNDKSKKVFDLSVDKILRHHLMDVGLVAMLENRIAEIAEPERRQKYEQLVELHRNGYRISKDGSGRYQFLIVKDSNSLTGFSLSEIEFRKIGNMGDYIEKLRKN